jgi:Ca2+-binding EF-hand superfamily protein
VKECIGDVAAFTNPDHLKHLKVSKVEAEMLGTYDMNHDGRITWGEYNIANLTLKKELPYARTVFRFFDKNHDWQISTKELKKVKVSQLATYIGSGGKRRK